MSRNFFSLAALFIFSTGCATAPETAYVADGSIIADDSGDTLTIEDDNDQQPAPYADMDFQVRVELGAASPDQPMAAVYVDRILANLDDTWQGVSVPEGALEILWSSTGCWTAAWQGDMNPGTLTDLDFMLGEDASLEQNGDALDVWLNTDDRSFTVHPDVATDSDEPVVITVLLAVEQDGDELLVTVDQVLVRTVDEDGYAWDLQDPRD